jgi:hypothetical protein
MSNSSNEIDADRLVADPRAMDELQIAADPARIREVLEQERARREPKAG